MLHAQIRQPSLQIQQEHLVILAHIDDGVVGFGGVAGVVQFEGV